MKPFQVGDRFTSTHRNPWRGLTRDDKHVEVITFRAVVTASAEHTFNYEVVEVLDVVDPLPTNPEGSTRVGGTGGMTHGHGHEVCTQIRRADPPFVAPLMLEPRLPQWACEHGTEYDVPMQLSNDPDLEDISWHNDICPSFVFREYAEAAGASGRNGESGVWPDLRLWVDHVDPSQREAGPECPRFRVYEDGDALLETEDFDEALSWFKQVARKMLARGLRKDRQRRKAGQQ